MAWYHHMKRINLCYAWYALRSDIIENGWSFPSMDEIKRIVQEDLEKHRYKLLSEIIIEKETIISIPDRVFICASCWVEKPSFWEKLKKTLTLLGKPRYRS